jgi:hypothetical protein
MAAVTITTGIGNGVPAFPPRRGPAPHGATPRGRRPVPATYLRRRFAVVGLALGLVLVAAQAGAALGGSPLAAPERRPTVTSPDISGAAVSGVPISGDADTTSATVRVVVVRPGDSLWSIAQRLTPGEDPRPVVDEVDRARGGAPLVAGETILWPR